MTASASSLEAAAQTGGWRKLWDRHFAGITWKGLALIALLCLVNALRRKSMYRPGIDEPVAAWLVMLAKMFGLGLLFALPVALAVVATCNRVAPEPRRRYPALVVAVLVSSLVGAGLMFALEERVVAPLNLGDEGVLFAVRVFFQSHWLRYVSLAALFAAVYVYARTADESTALARQIELDRERLRQQMDEARLQVLQAQIEPHFLFNTLATVRRLYHTSPDSAVATLDNLMRYLGVALPQMRSGATTLGREAALAEAYLAIQKLRMGRRLGYAIDVPAGLRDAPMPPMMLLTLVENAIKHGLTPLPEGGFIRIGAAAEGGTLRVQVSDSGQGFVETSGAGTGLANIRARLAALYGRAGRLDLGLNRPRGVTATLTLPLAAAT